MRKRPIGSLRALVVLRWPVGGIRTYVLYNYPSLRHLGWTFTFVGPDDVTFRAFAKDLRGWDTAEFVAAPVRGRRCQLAATVREQLRTGRFNLMHSQGLTAAAQAVWANRGLGVPHLATAHDVFRPLQVAGARGWAKTWLLGRLLRRLDTLIACGDDVRANLLAYLPRIESAGCRLVTIRNGIDINRFAASSHDEMSRGCKSPEDLRHRLGLSHDVRLLGFLGRFVEQKGFLPLLEAVQRLKASGTVAPFCLVAVGSGDFEREYRAEVQRRRLADVVRFLDFVADVGPLLRQFDLLVIPSLWEACPLLPMEAMAAGVPVLGSDCIGLREVLRDTPSRMAAAGDAKAWSIALKRAIAAPWIDAARAFSEEAQRRFDVSPAAEQLARVFEEISAVAVAA
jgi:glycosyltransferase involved in cell wall biosynthesis